LRHPGNGSGFPIPLARDRAELVKEPRRMAVRFTFDMNRSSTCFTSSQRGSPSGD
jgi:hypothetical protein